MLFEEKQFLTITSSFINNIIITFFPFLFKKLYNFFLFSESRYVCVYHTITHSLHAVSRTNQEVRQSRGVPWSTVSNTKEQINKDDLKDQLHIAGCAMDIAHGSI